MAASGGNGLLAQRGALAVRSGEVFEEQADNDGEVDDSGGDDDISV